MTPTLTSPTISICIPTYHRRRQVLRQLAHIAKNAPAALTGIEILVSDNSTHADQFLTESDLAVLPFPVRYWVNGGNLGYAGNLEKLVRAATGKYIWLLSDDDPIYPEAIATVLSVIEANPDINYLTFDHDTEINGVIAGRSRWFKPEDNGFYLDGSAFLRKHLPSTSFVSINVFRRAPLIALVEELKMRKIDNRTHKNMLWAVLFIARHGNCYCMAKAMFCENSGEKVWSYETSLQGPTDLFNLYCELQKLLPDPTVLEDFADSLYNNMTISMKLMLFESAYTRPDYDFTPLYGQLLALSFKNWRLRLHLRMLAAVYTVFRKRPTLLKNLYHILGRGKGWRDMYEWVAKLDAKRREQIYVSSY